MLGLNFLRNLLSQFYVLYRLINEYSVSFFFFYHITDDIRQFCESHTTSYIHTISYKTLNQLYVDSSKFYGFRIAPYCLIQSKKRKLFHKKGIQETKNLQGNSQNQRFTTIQARASGGLRLPPDSSPQNKFCIVPLGEWTFCIIENIPQLRPWYCSLTLQTKRSTFFLKANCQLEVRKNITQFV